ncbi:ADP-ribosylation factor-binding protein GGA1-like [Mizuhopecten yessoensis]|uniref:ADP-ribosylation factor-binding protein GGA1 n=1 Tax=Mizuhopecten yessoensis TaxID=6573 RepID=A0A210PMZ4_MIZYE|nr:ADP-ribosylation factor-binding protein GGA1-like [Mizuhopecten yessoensis]OWF37796.1 ADP-ribosylation factor-binding protein GGA1 [Mizuhopecten yessoensis]
MAVEGESLESLLNKATNPASRDEDWDHIMAFCDQINKELEGPQISLPLLAHKIQSPQEQEALLALTTVEACVKNCGKLFHQELGKFRFLNEMIKVVSPKYLGNRTTMKVKKRCIELIYSWSRGLPHESKVLEAYQMLKQQGIVKEDPTYLDKAADAVVPSKARTASFEDEEKSKLLSKLLKSKNPNDLQAANRLIKNMVKQDESRMEKVSRRINELKTITINVKLLNEMVSHFKPEASSQSDRDMMKELYESLEKLRPNLFRLASDADEKDNDGISEILSCNDEVMKAMGEYKKTVEGVSEDNSETAKANTSALLDLALDQSSPSQPMTSQSEGNADISLILDGQFQSLGLQDPQPSDRSDSLLADLNDIFGATSQTSSVTSGMALPTSNMSQPVNPGLQMGGPGMMLTNPQGPVMAQLPTQPQGPAVLQANQATTSMFSSPSLLSQHPSQMTSPMTMGAGQGTLPAVNVNASAQVLNTLASKGMADLDLLGQDLMQQSLPKEAKIIPQEVVPQPKLTLNQIASKGTTGTNNTAANYSQFGLSSQPASVNTTATIPTFPPVPQVSPAKITSQEILSLADIFVPLEKIQPSSLAPVNAYDKNGLKMVIHCGKDRPRDDVSVMVVSVISTNTNPVKNFSFQAAVPKVMKVKLQPPSATDLPAYNPILPPAAITQVMLFANPHKENIRLKFKITYVAGVETHSDVGEVDTFPIQ